MLTKMEHSPILPSPPALQGYWALSKCCTDIGQHSHSLGGEWRQQQSVLRALDGGVRPGVQTLGMPLITTHLGHIVQTVLRNLCPHLQSGKIAFTSM